MPSLTIQQAIDLALQHHRSGRLAEAEQFYRQILALQPQHPDALHFMGVLAHQSGRNDAAVELMRKAIEAVPTHPDFHSNLGEVYRTVGQLDAATDSFRRAIQLRPDYAEAYNNLGRTLWETGRLDESIAASRRAIQLRPGLAEAHTNLGNALRDQGRVEEAMESYRRAVALNPDFAQAHNNLGAALSEQARFDEAIATYRRALELKPDYVEAHCNLGNALKDDGRLAEAAVAYRRALQLQAHYAEAHSNLLFCLHYPADFDPDATFREHCRWDEAHGLPLAKFPTPHGNDASPERRLRIGYVSPDFREHSVAFFLEALMKCHDRSQVEMFCYTDAVREDSITARLRECGGQWRKVAGMSDERVAEIIRGDGVDILVDLAGHSGSNRLLVFARKPAPVQVTWLGYCDTTGMSTMDYRFSDAHADPPGMTEHLHTERLVRLPDSAWCFRPSDAAPPVGALPALESGHVTFGCFNVLPKITEEFLALWSGILQRVPGSRLLLKNLGFRNAGARERTRSILEKNGVAAERVELVGHVPTLAEHLALYGRVDIALDTYPYHGTTTTCEALWQGVPVVTLAGRTHASRVGVSLLSNVGLGELIAQTPEEYEKAASALAADVPRLAELRATLRERMARSPLMDAPRFARNVEAAYREMWRAWCAEGAVARDETTGDRR